MTTSRMLALAATVSAFASLQAAADDPVAKPSNAPELDTDAMVELPGGTFTMGEEGLDPRPYGDAWFVDQTPAHEVTVSTFRMDRREVTVAEFAQFLTHAAGEAHRQPAQPIDRVAAGYLPAAGTADEPIRHVTWTAARDYCAWAGKRLPTEAEWERGAAGLEGRIHPWGEAGASCDRAAFFAGQSFCVDGPRAVAAQPTGATPAGLQDLGGNVGEWVADWYGPYGADPQTDPEGPTSGTYRVVRGGGHLDVGHGLRTTARRAAPPERHAVDIGFRCAWGEDVPELPGARRGLLEPPQDESREPRESEPPRAEAPEVVVEGLAGPAELLVTGDELFLVERDAGRVLAVERATRDTRLVAEGLVEPGDVAVASDGTVWITDREADQVLRVPAGGGAPVPMATGERFADRVIAFDGGVLWSTVTSVRRLLEGATEAETVESSLNGVVALHADETDLWILEDGAAGRLLRQPLAGGTGEVFLELTDAFLFSDLALGSDELWVGVRLDGFPNSSLPCVMPLGGGELRCDRYGPVRIGRLALAGDEVFWTTNWIVARSSRSTPTPYVVEGPFTAPSSLVIADGALWWTDERAGRLLRSPL